ncbi:MAG: DUF3373 family protein [Nitrospirae bacterium]|nr:MAG: DUF3373 family protein [Nitrospirota bacterium]
MKRFLVFILVLLLMIPATSFALSQEELMQKIQDLSRQLEQLKKQMEEMQNQQMQQQADIMDAKDQAKEVKDKLGWLTIGGDYRFRIDSLKGKVHEHFNFTQFENALNDYFQAQAFAGAGSIVTLPGLGQTLAVPVDMNTLQQLQGKAVFSNSYDVKNDSLFLNRFRLNLKAQVTENISAKVRLAMYKVWGHQTSGPVSGEGFFADRTIPAGAPFDGQTGHIPQDNKLVVDYAYATWSNVFGQPIWFSVGRRPSTHGVPGNLRQNEEKVGTAGVPCFLVDYAFDGMTLGWAPYIEALPGFYAKICYGKGFDSGYRKDIPGDNTPDDVNFVGLNIVPIDTDNLHIEVQWNRAFDIFDTFPDSGVKANLGDIDQYGLVAMTKFDDLGPGDLNLFVSGAISRTHPSDEVLKMDVLQPMDTDGDNVPDSVVLVKNAPLAGLLYNVDSNGNPIDRKSRSGYHIYVGARYDLKSSRTKIGLEYNHGSKYWITFGPASDDIWTNKLGTRGDVYEAYIIQELPELPISKLGNAFFRLGYQYYKFRYTGSNSWIGAPEKIEDLTATGSPQFMEPLKHAQDIYFTFDVTF